MQLTDFLRTVLPTQGNYYTVQITNQGIVRQYNHETIEYLPFGASGGALQAVARHLQPVKLERLPNYRSVVGCPDVVEFSYVAGWVGVLRTMGKRLYRVDGVGERDIAYSGAAEVCSSWVDAVGTGSNAQWRPSSFLVNPTSEIPMKVI